ncbi:MAG: hypothetical protein AAF843_15405 [Bacteroidota bacterium]
MKIKINTILILGGLCMLLMFFSACSDDDSADPDDEVPNPNITTGFISVGNTSSGNQVVRYFEELPTGTVDLSENATDFIRFRPEAIFNGAIYSHRIDGTDGFSKIVVDADQQFVEEGAIPISSGTFAIAVKDESTGVFQDFGTPDVITMFDPATFQLTTSIDMSAGSVPGDVTPAYQRFIFRGDDVFSVISQTDGSGFNDFIVHQANLSNNTFVGDTRRVGNGLATISRDDGGQGLTDAGGNLYIPDAGDIWGRGNAARLNKILAGSNEIDATYIFEPALTLNPQNTFLPYFRAFKFLESGKAIAVVNREVPQEVETITADAGGSENLTTTDQLAIFNIWLQAETAVWCEIDVETLTVTPIAGIPAIRPLTGTVINFEFNEDVYIPAETSAESAYYKWNPTTGDVTKAFTMTGVTVPTFYNLGSNN